MHYGLSSHSIDRQELQQGILDVLHLDRLVEDQDPVVGRDLLGERSLPGTEQDQGFQVVAILMRFLVHVEVRLHRVRAEAVGVEDDGVGR